MVGILLDHLGGQQARILRGTGDGRYEIYHDVLAAAILDWRARSLRAIRTARNRRILLLLFLLCLLIGGIVGLNLAAPRSALRAMMGWLIGLSITGELLILGLWAWRVLIIRPLSASRLAHQARSSRR